MKDRVLIILPSLSFGGVERVRLVIAKCLLERGYDVDILTIYNATDTHPFYPSATYITLGLDPRISTFLAIWPLFKFFLSHRYEIILGAIWPLTFAVSLTARITQPRSRIIVSEHNNLQTQYSHFSHLRKTVLTSTVFFTSFLSSKYVVVSEGVAKCLSTLTKLPQKTFTVIHNPLTINLNDDQVDINTLAALRRSSSRISILTVGRLKKQKNHHMLIQSVATLIYEGLDIDLVIAGDGPMLSELKFLARNLGISQYVTFTGYVSNTDSLYREATHFVLSSSYEGFANVLVEALYYGLPILATDCDYGPREILNNGKYGILTPSDDLPMFINALREILKHPGLVPSPSILRARALEYSPFEITELYVK